MIAMAAIVSRWNVADEKKLMVAADVSIATTGLISDSSLVADCSRKTSGSFPAAVSEAIGGLCAAMAGARGEVGKGGTLSADA